MENLIEIVNRLQEVFSSTKIGDLHSVMQLPQIVVIGAQSAGKSSVLEGIVGKDFLPRGTGIVTRRPLILHLNNCPIGDARREKLQVGSEEDFAIFAHCPEAVYTDFDKVRAEIDADTDRKAGTNKGICLKEIILTIHSHRLVKLSLVDLPGITKVPIGDQPEDIEMQIRDMIMHYIRNPNSLILAVSAANVDFATSESIKLAQKVDKKGKRTLAVMTKLDLMDAGTDARRELKGEIIRIQLGIVGVVNRSYEDTQANKPIKDCWADEARFFKTHYPDIAETNGIQYLGQKLHKMLMEHICTCLPSLKGRILEHIETCKKQLEILGEPIKDPQSTFLNIVNRFSTAYNNVIMGTVVDTSIPLDENDLYGGAQISWIFHTLYAMDLEKIDPKNLSIESIHKAVLQTTGLHPPIIVPEKCFEELSRQQIKLLEKPSLKCLGQVHEEMKKAIKYCDGDLMAKMERFPQLRNKIFQIVHRILDERAEETKRDIQKLVGAHEAFINTKHPDFSSERSLLNMLMNMVDSNTAALVRHHLASKTGQKKVDDESDSESETPVEMAQPNASVKAHTKQKIMTKRDADNCKLIRSLVNAYFKVVRKSVQDHVIKTIYYTIIKHIQDNLAKELVIQLHKNQAEPNVWLEEDAGIAKHRSTTEERLETLLQAEEVLYELGNYAI